MAKLLVAEFMTLDGVMEAPEKWQFPYFGPDFGEFVSASINAIDTFLLGRVTYDIFAGSWPNEAEDGSGISTKLNQAPKYVVSNTLEKADWNNTTILRGAAAESVAKLKAQTEGLIGVNGSGKLARTLMENNLVDEYNLMIHPVVVGHGQRLFEEGTPALNGLQLVETKTFSTGIISLVYRPAAQ
jgi:dihydrofolate reductase